jgi:hypothetical protein
MVLTAMSVISPKVVNWVTIALRLHRLNAFPFFLGTLQANAVACARTSGGKTPGCTRAWQVCQVLGFTPATTPFAYHAVTATGSTSNILVAPFGMFMDIQDDFGTLRFALRGVARVDELAQIGYFVVNELYGILGFGSSHFASILQALNYLILLFSEHIYAFLYLANL